jgi:thioredoxin reductase (NADPH)
MTEKNEIVDLIIIGSGPAGLSAGINAARAGCETLILEAEEFGGKAAGAAFYENYPGFPNGIAAMELLDRMRRQALKLGARIRQSEEVTELDLKQRNKRVITTKRTCESTALVIATGTQRKKLGVPGEAELIGRGVSYCQVCDGPFFKGLRVAVVGSTTHAQEDALRLSELAREIVLITQGDQHPPRSLLGTLHTKPNLTVIQGSIIAILGEHVVNAVKLVREDGQEETEPVNGVFVSLGKAPVTEIFGRAGVAVDERCCIKVDRAQRTNIEGVYAAGDCTCGGMQVATAVGEGAMASLKAVGYIRSIRGE